MRKRFLGMATVAVALSAVVIGTTPASAAAGWDVDPGGPATGTAGETVLAVRPGGGGDDLVMSCQSSSATLNSFDSATDHVADINGISFVDCVLAGLISFEVVADVPWTLHASSYSAPVVTGQIQDISATIIGAGCLATVGGSVNGSFNNDTEQLTVDDDFTLQITSVDPVDNCLGLINTGDAAAFSGVYTVNPGQNITPA